MERKTLFNSPMTERTHPSGFGGVQKIYRFPNDYGASVVRFRMPYGDGYGSYTADETEWELAVIKFNGDGDGFELSYDTPVTDDVIGHLKEKDVERILGEIKNLIK